MSDLDETVYSKRGPAGSGDVSPQPAPPAKPKQKIWLIIGGVGCLLLICLAVLLTAGVFLMRDRLGLNELAGLGDATAMPIVETPTEAGMVTPSPVITEPVASATTPAPSATATSTTTPSPTPIIEPKFGSVTFALGATADYRPINPGLTFQEGITVVHAIFEYSGMSKEKTWERVWYLDGKEILRNSQKWTGDTAGVFDYFIDAGKEPLFPGKWVMELSVEGKKLANGSFTITPKITPTTLAQAGGAGDAAAKLTPTPSLTATVAVTPTRPASGGGVYKLAYTKWDGGQHNLYVADTSGKGERFLLNRADGPSWTPDGKEIFFYGEAGVDRQKLTDGREFVFGDISNGIVALVNASALPGADAAQLYQGLDWKQGTARWANVSPDGLMVAFDAKPGGQDYRIYFLGTVDNQQFRFEILGEQADWSPNSQKIVYRSGRDGKTGIWISNRDDSGHTNITNNGSDSFPAWSPDGKTIAFSRDEGGNVDIYTVNVDGSNLKRLTNAPGPDSLPTYTPSGDLIFRSTRSGNWGIWKMSGDGANQKEIIPNAGVGPDWANSKMDVR